MISAGWGLFPVYRLALDAKPDRVMLWLAEIAELAQGFPDSTASISRQRHFVTTQVKVVKGLYTEVSNVRHIAFSTKSDLSNYVSSSVRVQI